ncbi:MAG: DUF86 domain-containing protein [Methanomassiliicoccaceae archaeon]|nr:DUF86 domain-containing protein [Methanomassiliicoccaceae archaeon]
MAERPEKDISRLNTILKYCAKIEDVMNEYGKDIEDFMENPRYQDLCSFYTQQIGENAKNLSGELVKRHPEIRWDDMRETRNDIAHIYEWIDLEMIWNTITEDIPALKETCKKILAEIEPP